MRVLERVQSPRMGATVLFVGTVRDHSGREQVSGITYEAYGPMAERQLEEVAAALSKPEQEVAVAISHRHGRLVVGDLAVVIAAAAPHRAAAFEACREAIERVKQDVPIWKRETTADGETWVGWSGG
jgi:molybdopterin synthase catalytic subunit